MKNNPLNLSARPTSLRTKVSKCASCGSTNVSTSYEDDRFSYGAGSDTVELSAVVPVRTCHDCGSQFTDDEAEILRHEAICNHLGLLTPAQIRDVRIRYGKNRAEFASLSRLGEATLGRWEAGATLQNAAYDQYLRLLQFPENIARLSPSLTDVTQNGSQRNVVRFPAIRLRALASVSSELVEAQKAFQLHR